MGGTFKVLQSLPLLTEYISIAEIPAINEMRPSLNIFIQFNLTALRVIESKSVTPHIPDDRWHIIIRKDTGTEVRCHWATYEDLTHLKQISFPKQC